jgi:hypothetical protein
MVSTLLPTVLPTLSYNGRRDGSNSVPIRAGLRSRFGFIAPECDNVWHLRAFPYLASAIIGAGVTLRIAGVQLIKPAAVPEGQEGGLLDFDDAQTGAVIT